MVVVKGIHHGHWPRQGEFHSAAGLAAQEMRVVDVDRVRSRDGPDDDRNIGIVTVADAYGFLVLEIDTLEVLDEGGDEVPAALLTVGDNVDARVLLIEQGEPYRVTLALGQLLAFEQPGRPELMGRRQPLGLRQASGNSRGHERGHGFFA